MFVPIYYLRKPIYLLIRHAQEQGEEYGEFKIDNPAESISETPAGRLKEDEKIFCAQTGISISYCYSITKGLTEFWQKVQSYWVGKKGTFPAAITEALKKTGKFRKKVKGKSSLQFDVYNELADYDEQGIPCLVEEKLALAVCYLSKMAAFHLKDNGEEEDVEKIIDGIKNLARNSESFSKAENIFTKHGRFWQTGDEFGKKIPDIFHGSTWVCYERTDGRARDDAKWGVALSKVEIRKPNAKGYTPIELSSEYVSGNYSHTGVIALDKDSGHLVAHLIREITHENQQFQTSAFFIMRLNHITPEAHGLDEGILVGHLSYYSVYYSSFITKAVIWINAHSIHAQKSIANLPKDLANNTPEFKEYVPQFVRTFLYNRLRNRLTMPSSNLINADENDWRHSIQQWLSKKNKSMEGDYVLSLCQGNYFVCYYYGDVISDQIRAADESIARFIRVDELCIDYNKDSAEFEVEYIHNREATPKEDNESGMAKASYRGFARRRNSTVQIVLNESSETIGTGNLIENTSEANYIYLAFCAPVIHKVAKAEFELHEYFPGIVAGLSDSKDEPIVFRMVVVRKDKLINNSGQQEFSFLNYRDNNVARRIERYFEKSANSRSIKVEAQSNKFIDLYPNLEELRLAGGIYEIHCSGRKYSITCSHKKEKLNLEDEDLNVLFSKADAVVSTWDLYEL